MIRYIKTILKSPVAPGNKKAMQWAMGSKVDKLRGAVLLDKALY